VQYFFLKYYPQGGDFKKNPLGLGIAKKNQGELTLPMREH